MFIRSSLHCLVLFCSTVAFAQPSTALPAPRIKISGHVVNSITGEPIARALVTINGLEGRASLTDETGAFNFESVSTVPSYFSVRKPGFFEPGPGSLPTPIEVKAAQNVVLKLAPAALITGRVIDSDEEPVEFAQVQFYVQGNTEGRKTWTWIDSTQTNEDGRFRSRHLPADSYLVSVGPYQNRGIAGETGYATVFFPNAPDRRSATPIRVSAGQQIEINFNVHPIQVFNVSGSIVGVPVDSLNLQITEASGSQINIHADMNPLTHTFQVRDIPRGTYVIHATGFQSLRELRGMPGPPAQVFHGRLTVTIASDRNDLVLTIQPKSVIPIVVRREDVAGADSNQSVEQAIVGLHAEPLDDETQEAYSTYDEQGHLIMEGLDAGRYRIVPNIANPFGKFYIASVALAGADILSEPLVIPETPPTGPIEVVVRNDVARARVILRNGVGSAMILAVPDRGDEPTPVMGTCDPERGCSMPENFAPGAYTFYAFDSLRSVEYSNRKAMEAYSSKATHVTLSPQQTTDVTVDLIRTEP
jgi:Carboxypeptidase regulatory-like domain